MFKAIEQSDFINHAYLLNFWQKYFEENEFPKIETVIRSGFFYPYIFLLSIFFFIILRDWNSKLIYIWCSDKWGKRTNSKYFIKLLNNVILRYIIVRQFWAYFEFRTWIGERSNYFYIDSFNVCFVLLWFWSHYKLSNY